MFARAASATLAGVSAQPVLVEAHRGKGLPGLALVGLARGAVRESLVRVRSAIGAAGLSLGGQRVVVNLLPAELPKDASALDLALAMALLASAELVPPEALIGRRFYGELSLGGGLEAVRGAVIVADLARTLGETEIIVPAANAAEAASIPGVRVVGAADLVSVVRHLTGEAPLSAAAPAAVQARRARACLSEVRGQVRAKRALEIAAAGGHNLLFIGPPGSGKTMLARRLPGILPPLAADERIEVTRIHSAVGATPAEGLFDERPFRAPHHTSSDVALCGGGFPMVRPGEVTLAHRGVLFLDELPEFSRRALESLREPLEEGHIHIARAQQSMLLPAQVLLVAAMNPCPCGYHREPPAHEVTSGGRRCVCSFEEVQRYRARLSGPLLDRIDLHVLVEPVPYRTYAAPIGQTEASASVLSRVVAARELQRRRLGDERTNARMEPAELEAHTALDEGATSLVESAIDRWGLSTRAVGRALKVARTIADLGSASRVLREHVREALSLRVLDFDDYASREDVA